ncbi:MAG: tetratricopeptide repeat protein [Comamonas sp.]|nr:tetratricopeptide repeat protein [Comamonas sp.]
MKKQEATELKKEKNIPEDGLQYAIDLQQQWRFEDAKKQYETIIQENSEDADALHNLGVLFSVQLLSPEQALPYFEAALSIHPDRLQFWFSYLDALIKINALDMAEQVLVLARNYGLNELQISSFERDIRLARTTVEDVVCNVLQDAPPLPEVTSESTADKNSTNKSANKSPEPSVAELQKLLSFFNQKKYDQAGKIAKTLLKKFPKNAYVWTLLAESEKCCGHQTLSLDARQQAARLRPDDAAMQTAWADALTDAGKEQEAEAVVQSILQMQPGYAPAHIRMADFYKKRADFNQALYSYAWALKEDANNPLVLQKLGAQLRAQGDQDGALVCFKAAVQASPNVPELLDAYGVTLRNEHRLAAAEDAFRKALQIHPGYVPALKNLCHLLEFHGRFAEAEAGLLRCAEIEDGSAETLYEVGRNLTQQKRDEEAVVWLRRAIEAKPNFVEAHVLLSKALNSSEEPSVVIEEIKKSIALLPHIPELPTNLGVVYLALSRADDAIACFRQALAINPKFAHARSSLLFALSHSSQVTPEELYREHRAYGKLIEDAVAGRVYTTHTNSRIPDRPLKVGFVSADFRNHAVAQFVTPFFDALSQYSDIISYAYSNTGARDASTLAIEKNMHVWRSIANWSNDEFVDKVREDEIDILVDVSGHTAGNRLGAFARHPAPIQVTWLGYPGTTGLKAMDYKFLNALYLKPDGAENFHAQFTEKLVLYPPSFTFKKNQEKIDVGPAPCLKNGYLTFGSFNRLNKISHEVVSAWCQILRAIPDARLIMGAMPSNGAPEEVVQWFEAEGVSLDRVFFYPRTGLSEYLKLHEQVDLCLDTFPYTGGTTTLHALWLGVPTLTIAGNTVSGRQSSANLHSVGLGEVCVARDLSGLLELAQAWSKKPELLNQVRRNLQAAYAAQDEISSPEVMVKSIVYAMRRMWMLWCSGQKPKSLMISNQDISLIYSNNSFEVIPLNTLLN